MDIADVWYWIMAFLLWLYVFTDGFDLGVGILCLHTDDEAWRDERGSADLFEPTIES